MRSFETSLKKYLFNKNNIKKAPQNPGVYLYLDKKDDVIYVGKAVNLKNRLSSYLSNDLLPKTKRMIDQAKKFSYIQVNSEVESLLLEARLVKKYMPIYNIELKDDKSPLYIAITDDEFPKVLSLRKKDIKKTYFYIGPFPSSSVVKRVLRSIRRIIPYSDHKIGKRKCFYSHIGLCDPCPNQIVKENDLKKKNEYQRNIKRIKLLLNGRVKWLRKEFLRKIDEYSKGERFEEAASLRNKLLALEYVTQPVVDIGKYLQNPNLLEDIREKEMLYLKMFLSENGLDVKNLDRVECFDVAHVSGVNPTASMVTFVGGEPDKTLYRHFRIRQSKGTSDTDSLAEVAKRRKNNNSKWGIPDLIIVDGGKGQVSSFLKTYNEADDPLVIGIAKRTESIVFKNKDGKYIIRRLPKGPALYFVQRIRDEAHRFARRYHHKLMDRSLTT